MAIHFESKFIHAFHVNSNFTLQKIHRENLIDGEFIKGPLKKLAWTEWTLAITSGGPGRPIKRGAKFKYSERYNVYMRKNLFDNDFRFISAVYEVGVMLPGYKRRKIYPVFYRPSKWGISAYKGVEPIALLSQQSIRQETNRVLNVECDIYMRRGVLKNVKGHEDEEKKMKSVKEYLKRFDYRTDTIIEN